MLTRQEMIDKVKAERENDSWAQWFEQMTNPKYNTTDDEIFALMEVVLSIRKGEE